MLKRRASPYFSDTVSFWGAFRVHVWCQVTVFTAFPGMNVMFPTIYFTVLLLFLHQNVSIDCHPVFGCPLGLYINIQQVDRLRASCRQQLYFYLINIRRLPSDDLTGSYPLHIASYFLK